MSYTPNRYSEQKSSAAATKLYGSVNPVSLSSERDACSLGRVLAELPVRLVHHERLDNISRCNLVGYTPN